MSSSSSIDGSDTVRESPGESEGEEDVFAQWARELREEAQRLIEQSKEGRERVAGRHEGNWERITQEEIHMYDMLSVAGCRYSWAREVVKDEMPPSPIASEKETRERMEQTGGLSERRTEEGANNARQLIATSLARCLARTQLVNDQIKHEKELMRERHSHQYIMVG